MGLYFKKNKSSNYKIYSSFTDKPIHKNWINETEVKKILIERAASRFIDNVFEIYIDFPNGYTVNNKIVHEIKENDFLSYKTIAFKNGLDEALHKNFYLEIKEKLNIDWKL